MFISVSEILYSYICLCKIFQVIKSLFPDPMKQEPLLVENIPDPLAGEQVPFLQLDLSIMD